MKTTKTTKIVAALGITAGLGLAALPAFSYAAEVSGDVKVETEVEPSLAMRIHSNADQTCIDDDSDPETPDVCTDSYGFIGYNPATAQGSTDPAATASGVASQATGLSLSSNQADTTTLYSNISVRSNTGKFKVEVADADADTAMRNEAGSTTENQYIPAGVTMDTTDSTVINPGIAGWALKGGDIASWTAITTSDASPLTVKALDTNTTNPLAYSSDITVNYAVSSGLTKTDTYSDVITYTATALDSDYSLEPTSLSEIDNMQDMTPAIVAGTEAGAYKTLTDTRGGSYTVAKLADGNIWMTQDLKLGGSSALTLTPDDSDVTSNYTLPAENTGTWCQSQDASCYNQSLMRKTGAPNGYLYNWYAATAGTGVYGTGANQNATASICPKGWKLPIGGASGQFKALDIAYGGTGSNRTGDTTQVNKFLASPLNFNYTGYVNGGSVNSPSDGANYWSRTADSEAYAYSLRFGSNGYFFPQNYGNDKYYGYAVRCVAAS